MKLSQVTIQNFRSCKHVAINLDRMHALVGGNNAGKSCILRALDFLFNPSSRGLSEEAFWNKDTSREIRVEAVFSELTEEQKESLRGYLMPDGSFHMARTASFGSRTEEGEPSHEDDEDKISISQHYKALTPEVDFLQASAINGKSINGWWSKKDTLKIGTLDFAAFLGSTKPQVSEWQAKAKEFVEQHGKSIPMREAWNANPKGYAGVLKGTLPFFVLVPAVRDVADESKATKASPFGRILSAIFASISEDQKKKIDSLLSEVSRQMNRIGGEERLPLIAETEKQLNALLGDFFRGCDLEIEFETPTLEVMIGSPKLFVDDGFRNSVGNKGHGLQRAVIFAILRRYAEQMTAAGTEKKRNVIFCVEEPELYMHPQAQRSIRRVFRKLTQSGDQVFFSTHSALLVDVMFFDEILRVENKRALGERKSVPESVVWQISMQSMIDDIILRNPSLKGKVSAESLRELYANVYNPRRNEGFFASKIVLVEGATEEYALTVYGESVIDQGIDSLNMSIVECGGKSSMDRLFRIFNELRIPCYIVFDYDKGNSDTAIIAKSRELLEMIGAPVAAPSEVTVAESYTCFPNTWETDLKPSIAQYEELARGARREMGEVGKALIARYIARKLTGEGGSGVPSVIKDMITMASKVNWAQSVLKSGD